MRKFSVSDGLKFKIGIVEHGEYGICTAEDIAELGEDMLLFCGQDVFFFAKYVAYVEFVFCEGGLFGYKPEYFILGRSQKLGRHKA